MSIRFDGLHDGPTNMARDASLLETGEISGRVYGWEGPWVSLGRFQKPDSAFRPEASIPWVERPTGGRGVLHGHDVTVGLAFPLAVLCPPEHWRSIRAVYRATISPLVSALRVCGIDADLGESLRTNKVSRSPDCFAAVSPNDIIDRQTGLKVCGCALKLTDTAVLAQCSIPAGPPLVDPSLVYHEAGAVHWIDLDHESFAQAISQAISTNNFAHFVR